MMSTFAFIMAALASTASANFFFGSVSGEQEAGSAGGGPAQMGICNYFVVQNPPPGGNSVTYNECNQGVFTPADGTGSCPGQANNAPNFCGIGLAQANCPPSFQLKKGDDCGAAMNNNGGGEPTKGTFYADVIDTAHNNKVVGRCVYELGNQNNCLNLGSQLAQTIIQCYMTEGC